MEEPTSTDLPDPGAHIVTRRRAYVHHGIYIGDGLVASRVGEDRYHFLNNNCEHFCEWCLRAEHRSHQVDRLLSWPLRVLERMLDVVARVITLPGYFARVHDELAVGKDRSLVPALPPRTRSAPLSRE